MEDKNYFDRCLIKLKRDYGKDEFVAHLLKLLKERDIEIGKLNSEIDYLTYELKSKKYNIEINQKAMVEIKKDELYSKKENECNKLKKEIKQLKQVRDSLLMEKHSK
jgi:hypothetical protein